MGKIAVMEDVDGIRGEIDVGEETEEQQEPEDAQMEDESKEESQTSVSATGPKGKCIPTVIEVQDAFEAMNTLRYSQPIHLQGASGLFRQCSSTTHITLYREMPGSDDYCLQRRPQSWGNNMENPLSFFWNYSLRSESQPHEGTASGRNRSDDAPREHRFRLAREAGSSHHRR